MNSTVRIKASEVYKDWHVVDAAGRPLGRVATEVATLLRGKHKPTYEPHLDDGDFVIVINASQVKVSGRKAEQNTYYTHSGYPGGLKARSFAEQMARFPDRVIEQAVWGMLPGGPLGKKMLKHLKVYAGPNHPHQSQIAGSLKAQEARKAATAELANVILKAPRLRPLSVPQVTADVPPAPAPVAGAPSPAAAVAKQARARVRKTAEPAPAETAEPAPAAVAEAPVAEAVTEAPAPGAPTAEAPKRTRRKAAVADAPEATAEAKAEAAEAPKKPARRRSTAKSETSEE
ncbi:MAG: 50S ribosomal protein L13 [Dehalococcoidia bacterium]|nr:50S ribosomal protein L13 [Dehalococcoidia bacterium]